MTITELKAEMRSVHKGSRIDIGGGPCYVMRESTFLTALEIAHQAGRTEGAKEASESFKACMQQLTPTRVAARAE